jgi:hypothetical protein
MLCGTQISDFSVSAGLAICWSCADRFSATPTQSTASPNGEGDHAAAQGAQAAQDGAKRGGAKHGGAAEFN